MAFGRHLANKFQDMLEGPRSKVELPENVPPALETFQSMTYGSDPDLWFFSNLKDVFKYLRGGKTLEIPAEWKPLIPRSFPNASDTV